MGLAVDVGSLSYLLEHDPEGAGWLRESLAVVNRLLESEGHPTHDEPESVPPLRERHCASFPYSYLHYLRRAYARVKNDVELTPVAEGEDPADDYYVDDELTMFESHLICHSDCEGFYVPIDFGDPLFGSDEIDVSGGMLGSCHALLRELEVVAPAIGIDLGNGVVTAESAEAINADDSDTHPYAIERLVWLTLHLNARHAIAHGSAINFC